MVYVDVKADTPQLTSARQVLDGKYPLHFGPGRTVSLLPDGVAPPRPADDRDGVGRRGADRVRRFRQADVHLERRRRDRRATDLRLLDAQDGRHAGRARYSDGRAAPARCDRAARRRRS
jgi:hypothetical protein